MSGCGSLKVCGWLAGASVRAARCGLVQSGRAACARPVPRMRSSTESYPARHRPRRDDRRHRATRIQSLSVCHKCGLTILAYARFPPLVVTPELPSSRSRRLSGTLACSQQSPSTMSKPSFQRMSQDQETQLGHNCALDIYSDPQAFRKVRAPLTLSRLHRCARAPPLSLLVVAALFGSAPSSAPSAPRPKASR